MCGYIQGGKVMAIPKAERIWMNGQLVPWDEAKVHVLVHGLHYGSSVFEGLRAYETPRGPAIFRLNEHVERMFYSCQIFRMPIPFSRSQITNAIVETVRANGHKTCYIRPVVFRGYGGLPIEGRDNPVEVSIATWEWGAYLGEEALTQGVEVMISSWRRMAPGALPAMAKIGGQYVNNQLAVMEAHDGGFAEAIMLDANGYLSEGTGENLFLVRDGMVYTPPLSASVLPGITRDSILTLAGDLGYPVREEFMSREMLFLADEVFMTGTAAEVTPIRAVDRIPVGGGGRGPVTEALQKAFFAIVRGETKDQRGWLTLVA
jgi:branched-chain amino acid aminotransferase